MAFLKSRFTLLATAVLLCGLAFTGFWAGASPTHAASPHFHPNCASNVTLSTLCTEVWDTEQVFGEGQYVGHDEPSTLFYSNQPGSGNQMRYQLTIPKDPLLPRSSARPRSISSCTRRSGSAWLCAMCSPIPSN